MNISNISSLFEKKNFVLNCSICDARKVKEEDLARYEHIIINSDVLLVNEESKSVLARLPMVFNTDCTLDVEGDVNLINQNGDYELTAGAEMAENTALIVNGNLKIHPGTENILRSLLTVSVNGRVLCPESLVPLLKNLSLNGELTAYPDGCLVLASSFSIDPYFPLRARENGNYFVADRLYVTDPKADIALLVSKHARFVTPSAVVIEEKAADALALFDETVKLEIVPAGYAYVSGNACLDGSLLSKYGSSLYIDGSLSLNQDSAPLLPGIEKLIVKGQVSMPECLQDAFLKVPAEYDSLDIQKESKEKYVEDRPYLVLDNAMLDACPDGLIVQDCAVVRIEEDVPAEKILERAKFHDCMTIKCSPEQQSSVSLVSADCASISTEEDGEKGPGLMNTLGQILQSKVVNADKYIL